MIRQQVIDSLLSGRKRCDRKGFTLVEILIVAAILALIASITIPNMLRSRISASETAAVASLRSIFDASQMYFNDNNEYAANLTDYGPPGSSPPYIDSILAAGLKHGYEFDYNSADSGHYEINANPAGSLIRGRYFFMDETGIIRGHEGEEAGEGDDPIN